MQNHPYIDLLEMRLNRLERNNKTNHNICRKLRREIERLKKEMEPGGGTCPGQELSE